MSVFAGSIILISKIITRMKNVLFSFIFLFAFSLSNSLKAQDAIPSNLTAEAISANGVEILTNFKASKKQKKLIKKIKKYVSYRFLKTETNAEALSGKTVNVQINTDNQGLISAISVIEGQSAKIDTRVIELIKTYNAMKPISKANIAKPSVLQLDIPLVVKQYYIK